MVAEFRRGNGTTPVVLMGYANPIEAMGLKAFVDAALASGVDGVLVVDYPPEECGRTCRTRAESRAGPYFSPRANLDSREDHQRDTRREWLHLLRIA